MHKCPLISESKTIQTPRPTTLQKNLTKYKCQQVVSYKQREQVCVEPPPSALNMTLPAFVAERWRLQHGAHSYLSMSPADRALSSKPAGHRRRGRQTDGRTDA